MTIENIISQEIAHQCKCQYSFSFITDGHLFCTIKNNVIYQAQFLPTDSKTALEIRNIIQDWVLSRPIIKIDGISYQLDPDCSIVAKELGVTSCDTEATSQSTINVTSFVVAGCVSLILVIVVVIILVCCWVWRKKQAKRWKWFFNLMCSYSFQYTVLSIYIYIYIAAMIIINVTKSFT